MDIFHIFSRHFQTILAQLNQLDGDGIIRMQVVLDF